MSENRKVAAARAERNEVELSSARRAAFGANSEDFLSVTACEVLSALRPAKPTDAEINAALALLVGIAPKDEAEGALAAQMVGAHAGAMMAMRRMQGAKYLPQLEAYGRLADRLMKSYRLHLEALAKMRRGGEQTVKVEHVHVHAGAQAVVGNVGAGGRG